jgi:catechol 2,3-dioxygenase-like lactoylglutathione lyase family enzyme
MAMGVPTPVESGRNRGLPAAQAASPEPSEQDMSGISHVSIGVNDVRRAKAFYDPLMKLVGLSIRQADDESVDYGNEALVFSLETPTDGRPATAGNGVHIAFAAPDRETVDAFYREALRLGGRDAGRPGLRPQYSETYYGAFVFDPDGNKIEAVTEVGENERSSEDARRDVDARAREVLERESQPDAPLKRSD